MKMKRILILLVLASFLAVTESRQGWKTKGNGYFVYKAKTLFNTTRKLTITGKFSTMPNSQKDNVLIAAEDANGKFAFQVSVNKGKIRHVVRQNTVNQAASKTSSGSNLGYAFDFTIDVTQLNHTNDSWSHTVRSRVANQMSFGVETKDNGEWNLNDMTLYIGGYNQTVEAGDFFEGCLSNIMFQGTDIIGTYFQQYPNNTNPVRGSITVDYFSTVAETCEDVSSTVPPTTLRRPTTTAKPSTPGLSTTPSGADVGKASVSFIVLVIGFVFLFV